MVISLRREPAERDTLLRLLRYVLLHELVGFHPRHGLHPGRLNTLQEFQDVARDVRRDSCVYCRVHTHLGVWVIFQSGSDVRCYRLALCLGLFCVRHSSPLRLVVESCAGYAPNNPKFFSATIISPMACPHCARVGVAGKVATTAGPAGVPHPVTCAGGDKLLTPSAPTTVTDPPAAMTIRFVSFVRMIS